MSSCTRLVLETRSDRSTLMSVAHWIGSYGMRSAAKMSS
ncbi:hypothetical protein BC477_16205 [Clavibacter michiganensis subsp. michiganensis]|nr:hypothetical protein BC477_16205 [Clavibacter michiganensis subsp. michiganensis]